MVRHVPRRLRFKETEREMLVEMCFREKELRRSNARARSSASSNKRERIVKERQQQKENKTNLREPFPDRLARRRGFSRLVFDAISFQFPESSQDVSR